jgi:nitrous oxide reductase accessory protein NosL
MKFYFAPAKWGDYKMTKFESVLVTDYYTQKGLDGRKAFYVTGSDVIGPMGAELIPFGDRASAETFARDHSGRGIFPFNELTPEIVNGLDVSH